MCWTAWGTTVSCGVERLCAQACLSQICTVAEEDARIICLANLSMAYLQQKQFGAALDSIEAALERMRAVGTYVTSWAGLCALVAWRWNGPGNALWPCPGPIFGNGATASP
jgi:Tfp pilus assembly protein PilF